jgi:hypothetical protein
MGFTEKNIAMNSTDLIQQHDMVNPLAGMMNFIEGWPHGTCANLNTTQNLVPPTL